MFQFVSILWPIWQFRIFANSHFPHFALSHFAHLDTFADFAVLAALGLAVTQVAMIHICSDISSIKEASLYEQPPMCAVPCLFDGDIQNTTHKNP